MKNAKQSKTIPNTYKKMQDKKQTKKGHTKKLVTLPNDNAVEENGFAWWIR